MKKNSDEIDLIKEILPKCESLIKSLSDTPNIQN